MRRDATCGSVTEAAEDQTGIVIVCVGVEGLEVLSKVAVMRRSLKD